MPQLFYFILFRGVVPFVSLRFSSKFRPAVKWPIRGFRPLFRPLACEWPSNNFRPINGHFVGWPPGYFGLCASRAMTSRSHGRASFVTCHNLFHNRHVVFYCAHPCSYGPPYATKWYLNVFHTLSCLINRNFEQCLPVKVELRGLIGADDSSFLPRFHCARNHPGAPHYLSLPFPRLNSPENA